MLSGSYFKLFSLSSFSLIATLNSFIPFASVYFVKPSFIASIPALFIISGVSKSGSPTERFITSLPSAMSSFAFLLTASVADGFNLFTF